MNLSTISSISPTLFIPALAVGGTAVLMEATSYATRQIFKKFNLINNERQRSLTSYAITGIVASGVAFGLGTAGLVAQIPALITVVALTVSLCALNLLFAKKEPAIEKAPNKNDEIPTKTPDTKPKPPVQDKKEPKPAEPTVPTPPEEPAPKNRKLPFLSSHIAFNDPSDLKQYEEAAATGNIEAQKILGKLFFLDDKATAEQKEKGANYLKPHWKILYAGEICKLALFFGEKDKAQGLKILIDAAELFKKTDDYRNASTVLDKLACAYQSGFLSKEENAKELEVKYGIEAFAFRQKAADNGDADAQCEMYEILRDKDIGEALRYLDLAVRKKHGHAMFLLSIRQTFKPVYLSH